VTIKPSRDIAGTINKCPGHRKTPYTCSIVSKQTSKKLYPETSSNLCQGSSL
jgi:hypothetical protein